MNRDERRKKENSSVRQKNGEHIKVSAVGGTKLPFASFLVIAA